MIILSIKREFCEQHHVREERESTDLNHIQTEPEGKFSWLKKVQINKKNK